jgi:hypothetical protein
LSFGEEMPPHSVLVMRHGRTYRSKMFALASNGKRVDKVSSARVYDRGFLLGYRVRFWSGPDWRPLL